MTFMPLIALMSHSSALKSAFIASTLIFTWVSSRDQLNFFFLQAASLIHQLWHMSLSYIPPLVMSVYIHIIKFRSRISEIMI